MRATMRCCEPERRYEAPRIYRQTARQTEGVLPGGFPAPQRQKQIDHTDWNGSLPLWFIFVYTIWIPSSVLVVVPLVLFTWNVLSGFNSTVCLYPIAAPFLYRPIRYESL